MSIGPPPTRILSWQQLVQESDPDYQRLLQRPVIYEFSNGRTFLQPSGYYSGWATYLTDPYGNLVLDPFGEPIPLPQP